MDEQFAITMCVVIFVVLTALFFIALYEARRRELYATGRILAFYIASVLLVGVALFFFLRMQPTALDPENPWEAQQRPVYVAPQ